MGTTKVSIHRWLNKDMVHTHNGILFNHKKERNSATGRNMDGLGDIMVSEKKVRKILYDITYIEI